MGNLEIFEFTPDKQALTEKILSQTKRTAIGWHYCLDYSFALQHFDPNRHQRILDIGSGPFGNPLHDYLEKEFSKEVFAINRETPADSLPKNPLRRLRESIRRERLPEFHIDWSGDLLDFSEGNWDLILAISSLEHNEPRKTMQCWRHACSLLSRKGTFIGTFSIAGDGKTKWNDQTHAWDLSIPDAETTWDCQFTGNLRHSAESYRHPFLLAGYKERFGEIWQDMPNYLAAGTLKHGN